MIKLLLTTLNSKFIHSSLALRYLYTSAMENLDENNLRLDIKEFTINHDDDYITTEILRGDYGVVCFSVNIWNLGRVLNICSIIKKAMPSLQIVLGGPEVSHEPLALLQDNRAIDFIVEGEGEYAFTALCDCKFENPGLSDIPGLVYRDRRDARIYVNTSQEPLKMDSLPFPYKIIPPDQEKMVYYETSRGCPYSCSYCMSSIEKGIRALPEYRVKEELDYFLRSNISQVKLVDRTFNWDRNRCYRLLKHIIEKDNDITNWHFEISGEALDRPLLDLIGSARPGLFQFEVGVQSTNKETLKAVKRSANVEQVLENTRQLIDLDNSHVHVDLIAGLPYETYEIFKKSFNDVYGLKADHFQLGFLKLLKGTELRLQEDEYGYVFHDKPPYTIIYNKYLSVWDILRLKQIDRVLNLYYNRGGFQLTLDYLSKLHNSAFDFYEEFALFYYLKGFQEVSHRKEDLYRILKKYGTWKNRTLEGTEDGVTKNLLKDMETTLNEDAVKKFNRKGWNI